MGEWLYIHRRIATGQGVPADSELTGLLPRAMIKSAVKSAGWI